MQRGRNRRIAMPLYTTTKQEANSERICPFPPTNQIGTITRSTQLDTHLPTPPSTPPDRHYDEGNTATYSPPLLLHPAHPGPDPAQPYRLFFLLHSSGGNGFGLVGQYL